MNLDERGRFHTGIEVLDRKLGGGIPLGTVTALSATPASQSELFLYEFAAGRRTVYLSTVRTEAAIEAVLDRRGVDTDGVEVVRVDVEDPVEHARSVLPAADDGVNVVVDPVDVLEGADAVAYRRFLADLTRCVAGTENVAVLHCLRDEPTPAHRRDTVHVADLVFDLATEVRGDSVVNRLSVPKFREGQSLEDVIKLDLTSEVEVDMSRNIL